jgi:FAD/FMN-containing dehydrogenase/Fe-S oxidoreductase
MNKWERLKDNFQGEIQLDTLYQSIYATDASVYRQKPVGVAFPKNSEDIKELILFASENNISLIPRTAGTSLAGQCVGEGLVVDVSRHFTQVIHSDFDKKQITVQPGIIRDDLNRSLKKEGLFFGPNTSTSNRCMIGGMVGNNSSGTTSIKYGVTRDKVIKIKAILSDGSEVVFSEITTKEFVQKCELQSLEGEIYRFFKNKLSQKENQENIHQQFPKDSIHRRNTGYAVDELLDFELFGGTKKTINIAKLLCGSEGTLVFFTELTIQLDDLPPKERILVAPHFKDLQACMTAVVKTMEHPLYTCELMDKVILDCTKGNREQQKNRFFINGDPAAVLLLEVKANSKTEVENLAQNLINDLQNHNMGYHFPILRNSEIDQAMELRKAGLGLLANLVGDKKAVACIEDTAVDLHDLPEYINEFTEIMDKYNQQAVYYAHAGAGEIHLRPILNLKKSEDVKLFRAITSDTAHLVKKYKGSFSGEHGDGIVRAEFIPMLVGEENYSLFKDLKDTFDKTNIFNPGKIVRAKKMDENLRYIPDREEPSIKTIQSFEKEQGILRLAEKCNGSGDCRKSVEAGGVMCPSYRASKDEKDTTRARANALREFLTNSDKKNPFNHPELGESLDLCLSCKACASECPSGVDMAALKAEFLYQYQEENGYSLQSKLIANTGKLNKISSKFPSLSNWALNLDITKNILGFATQRKLPKLHKFSLRSKLKNQDKVYKKQVYLFIDEFTNYYDVEIGLDAVYLLNSLGYEVLTTNHEESGRTYLSKGFLKEAKRIANKNINVFSGKINSEIPLIGIEPSAILSFRDEYIRLAENLDKAKTLAKNTFTIEEFLTKEWQNKSFDNSLFTKEEKTVYIHGHCHQKALSSTKTIADILSIPVGYKTKIIASGCCGMAGSFGYEKEHFELSKKVAHDSFIPTMNKLPSEAIISLSGTSCRHQLSDFSSKVGQHPVSILRAALKPE